jgi:hypothetical protein
MRGQLGSSGLPPLCGAVQHGDPRQVETVEQRPMVGVDQHDLAVHLRDVAGQRRATPGGVDAAQHIAAEHRGGQRREHLRGVAEQHADVQRPLPVGHGHQCRRQGPRVGDVFPPGPSAIAVLDRHGVGIGALAKHLLECVRHGRLTSVWSSEQVS